MAAEPIVALEIGTSKVCALVGEARGDGLIMVTGTGRAPSRGVCKSLVVDLKLAAEDVQKALRDAEQSSGIEINEVFLVVSGGHIRCLDSQGSTPVADPAAGISAEDIAEVKTIARAVNVAHDWELLHSIPRIYRVDDRLVTANPLELRGAKLSLDMLLIHGQRAALENAVQAAHSVGVEVRDVAFSGLCAAMAVLTPQQKDHGAAVVDLGAGTTSYLVYAGNRIALAGALAVGGDHVTNDIALGFGISPQCAERLKRDVGTVIPDSSQHFQQIAVPAELGYPAVSVAVADLSAVIHARLDETLGLVAAELKRQAVLEHLHAGVVLTGGGTHARGIQVLAEQVFQTPCAIGRPFNFSGISTATDGVEHAALLGMLRYAARSLQRSDTPATLRDWLDRILGRS